MSTQTTQPVRFVRVHKYGKHCHGKKPHGRKKAHIHHFRGKCHALVPTDAIASLLGIPPEQLKYHRGGANCLISRKHVATAKVRSEVRRKSIP
jgi:hypothetical protein